MFFSYPLIGKVNRSFSMNVLIVTVKGISWLVQYVHSFKITEPSLIRWNSSMSKFSHLNFSGKLGIFVLITHASLRILQFFWDLKRLFFQSLCKFFSFYAIWFCASHLKIEWIIVSPNWGPHISLQIVICERCTVQVIVN